MQYQVTSRYARESIVVLAVLAATLFSGPGCTSRRVAPPPSAWTEAGPVLDRRIALERPAHTAKALLWVHQTRELLILTVEGRLTRYKLGTGELQSIPLPGDDQRGIGLACEPRGDSVYVLLGAPIMRLSPDPEKQYELLSLDIRSWQVRWRVPVEPNVTWGPILSEDGSLLVILGSDGMLRWRRASDGGLEGQLQLEVDSSTPVQTLHRADDDLLAVGCRDGVVRLVSESKRAEVARRKVSTWPVPSVAGIPVIGAVVATDMGGRVTLFDVASGDVVWRRRLFADPLWLRMAVSPEGRAIAVCDRWAELRHTSAYGVWVLDQTGRVRTTIDALNRGVSTLEFIADGGALAVGTTGDVLIYRPGK